MPTIAAPPSTSSIFNYPPNFPAGIVSPAWLAWFTSISANVPIFPAFQTGYAIGWDAGGNLVNVPNTGADQTAFFANTTNAAQGAGAVGYNPALSYAASTVGSQLNTIVTTYAKTSDLAPYALSADLADQAHIAKGAALVGYLAPYAGAVGRTQQAKNEDIISIKDFGAKGDGVTDDTAAFIAAAAWAGSVGGHRIYCPAGTYIVKAVRNYAGVVFFGDGISTILKNPAAMTAGDRVTNDGSGNNYDGVAMFYNAYPAGARVAGMGLENMVLDGNGQNQVVDGAKRSWGTYWNGVTGVVEKNVIFKNFLCHGSSFKEADHCLVDGCQFNANGQAYLVPIWNPADGANPGGDGLDLLSQCYDNVVMNSSATGNGSIGFEDEGRFGAYLLANRNYRNKWVNLLSQNNGDHNYLGLFSSDAIYDNCHSMGGASDGIELCGTQHVTINEFKSYLAGRHGIFVTPEIFGADGVNVDVVVDGAYLLDSANRAVYGANIVGGKFARIVARGVLATGHAITFGLTAGEASSQIELSFDYDGTIGGKAAYGVYAYNPTGLVIRDSHVVSCSSHNIWVDGSASGVSGVIITNVVSNLSGAQGIAFSGGTLTGYNNGVFNSDVSGNTTPCNFTDYQISVGNVTGYRKTVYQNAAPTVGTWIAGDRVINNAPTVGQPKAWVCTVGGTPGTWVSEGNL